MAEVALVISAIVAVGGAIDAREKGMTAKKDNRKARKAINSREKFKAQRARQRLLAQARVRRAQLEQAGESSGVSGASSVIGAQASTQSQAAGTAGFQNYETRANTQIANFQGSAMAAMNKGRTNAAMFGAVSSVSGLFSDPKRNKILFGE